MDEYYSFMSVKLAVVMIGVLMLALFVCICVWMFIGWCIVESCLDFQDQDFDTFQQQKFPDEGKCLDAYCTYFLLSSYCIC